MNSSSNHTGQHSSPSRENDGLGAANVTDVPFRSHEIIKFGHSSQNPYVRSYGGKCNRCGQHGHLSNNYQTRKQVNVVEHLDVDGTPLEEIFISPEDVLVAEDSVDDTGHLTEVIQRLMLTTPSPNDTTQRHNIFRAKCHISHNIFDVIIDSGSCENIISKEIVQRQQLPTHTHPAPYKLGWIKSGGELQVTEQCLVSF